MSTSSSTQNCGLRTGGIVLAVSYAVIMIPAGHGVGPIGLLLLFGETPEWILPMIFGWSAVILEFIAFLSVGKKRWKAYAALALGGFIISATLFVWNSEGLHDLIWLFGVFMASFVAMAIMRYAQIISRKGEHA